MLAHRLCALLTTCACSGTQVAKPPSPPTRPVGEQLQSAPSANSALRTGGTATPSSTPLPLELERVLFISGVSDFQPSGLLWFQGHLLTVSDNHDDAIYELVMDEIEARAQPFLTFHAPPHETSDGTLDFEGLTSDGEGGFLLASEEYVRVLHLPLEAPPRWLPSLDTVNRQIGLCQKKNAKLEGIVHRSNGTILLAVERDPRGLIEMKGLEDEAVAAWNMSTSAYPMPQQRSPDFSALTEVNGQVYALLRGAHLIVKLHREEGLWREGEAWSFEATENAIPVAYLDRTYGLAEGLAITPTHIFIALDNNGQGRVAARDDFRPGLLVFRRPPGL